MKRFFTALTIVSLLIPSISFCASAGKGPSGDLSKSTQNLTIADSGDGNPATDTTTRAVKHHISVTCSDVHNCEWTIPETGMVTGDWSCIFNVSGNPLVLKHSAGVVEYHGGVDKTLTLNEASVCIEYQNDRWVQMHNMDDGPIASHASSHELGGTDETGNLNLAESSGLITKVDGAFVHTGVMMSSFPTDGDTDAQMLRNGFGAGGFWSPCLVGDNICQLQLSGWGGASIVEIGSGTDLTSDAASTMANLTIYEGASQASTSSFRIWKLGAGGGTRFSLLGNLEHASLNQSSMFHQPTVDKAAGNYTVYRINPQIDNAPGSENTYISAGLGVNLANPVWHLYTGGMSVSVPDTQTVADSGDGNPATFNVTVASNTASPNLQVTCNDTHSCDGTMLETNARDGAKMSISNVSSNSVDFADSAGVLETIGGATVELAQYEAIQLEYQVDRWIQVAADAGGGSHASSHENGGADKIGNIDVRETSFISKTNAAFSQAGVVVSSFPTDGDSDTEMLKYGFGGGDSWGPVFISGGYVTLESTSGGSAAAIKVGGYLAGDFTTKTTKATLTIQGGASQASSSEFVIQNEGNRFSVLGFLRHASVDEASVYFAPKIDKTAGNFIVQKIYPSITNAPGSTNAFISAELASGLAWKLYTGGMAVTVPNTQTVADSGDGNPATFNVVVASNTASDKLRVTCNDSDSCEGTMLETNAVDGMHMTITNLTANRITFADSSGVQEMPGGRTIDLIQYESITFEYVSDRWTVKVPSPHHPSYSSLWYHDGEVATGIGTVNLFDQITVFDNEGAEDFYGNAVGDATTNDDITIGTFGGGTFSINIQASFRNASGSNKNMLIAPGITLINPIAITSSTFPATPTVIETTSAHGLKSGTMVTISGHATNTAVNTDSRIVVVDSTHFSLKDLAGVDIAAVAGAGTGGNVDIIYPGNVVIQGVVSGTDLERGAASGTLVLEAGDIIKLYVTNLTDANDFVTVQINMGIFCVED